MQMRISHGGISDSTSIWYASQLSCICVQNSPYYSMLQVWVRNSLVWHLCINYTLMKSYIYIYIALSSYTKGHKHVQELQKYMHNCSKHAVETSRCGYQLAAIPPDSLIMSNRVSRVKPKSLHLEHKITTWKQHDWKNGKTNNKKQCVTFPFQQLARLLYMTRKHSFAHTSKVLRRQPETNFQHFRCCITRC
jgi:hypothetical protein